MNEKDIREILAEYPQIPLPSGFDERLRTRLLAVERERLTENESYKVTPLKMFKTPIWKRYGAVAAIFLFAVISISVYQSDIFSLFPDQNVALKESTISEDTAIVTEEENSADTLLEVADESAPLMTMKSVSQDDFFGSEQALYQSEMQNYIDTIIFETADIKLIAKYKEKYDLDKISFEFVEFTEDSDQIKCYTYKVNGTKDGKAYFHTVCITRPDDILTISDEI